MIMIKAVSPTSGTELEIPVRSIISIDGNPYTPQEDLTELTMIVNSLLAKVETMENIIGQMISINTEHEE